MKIHHGLVPSADGARPLVLAIGFFDGFHRGHRELVRALLRLRRPGYRAAVLTFRSHPASFLRPGFEPPLITTLEERIDLLASSGIDELYLSDFDAHMAHTEARAFLLRALHEQLRVRALVVGENFRFGKDRAGDAGVAREVLGPLGVEVVAVPPLLDEDERISSTRVRAAIARGDFATANRLLGEPWTLRGRVVLGAGRGHDLGFPTANLDVPPEKMLPVDGVYAALARHDGRDRRALVSIGTNPTFDGRKRTVEAWLVDFQHTIYGEELSLRDLRFVREQRRFAGPDELLAQMQEDVSHVRFPTFSLT
ncbi:MAG: riboflavin biosynthesis protein RibF [Candidatus Baltobacteraceae bacterium]